MIDFQNWRDVPLCDEHGREIVPRSHMLALVSAPFVFQNADMPLWLSIILAAPVGYMSMTMILDRKTKRAET